MSEIKTEFVMEMRLAVATPLTAIGNTQYGDRRIARVTGGTFEGPRLSGTVRDGGGDWILNRTDGVTQLDVRLTMEATDGALIFMTYKGLRHGPADVMARLSAVTSSKVTSLVVPTAWPMEMTLSVTSTPVPAV